MNNPEMFKTFESAWEPLLTVLKNTLESISELRRPFVSRRLANAMLFRAAASFLFHLRAPTRNEAALNEAVELRDSALQFYSDDDERLKADIEGIISYFSPDAPVEVRRNGKGKQNKAVLEARARMAARKAEIDEHKEAERAFLDDSLPTLKGFLEGAKYKPFDIQGSEMAATRAHLAAVAAMDKMRDRIERDVIVCGNNLDDACTRLEDSETYANKQSLAHWEAEYMLAEEDLKAVEAVIKAEGLQPENNS